MPSIFGFIATLVKSGVQDQITAIKSQAVIISENKGMINSLKAGNYMLAQGYPQHAQHFYDKANESRRKIVSARDSWEQTGRCIGIETPGLMELPKSDFTLPERG